MRRVDRRPNRASTNRSLHSAPLQIRSSCPLFPIIHNPATIPKHGCMYTSPPDVPHRPRPFLSYHTYPRCCRYLRNHLKLAQLLHGSEDYDGYHSSEASRDPPGPVPPMFVFSPFICEKLLLFSSSYFLSASLACLSRTIGYYLLPFSAFSSLSLSPPCLSFIALLRRSLYSVRVIDASSKDVRRSEKVIPLHILGSSHLAILLLFFPSLFPPLSHLFPVYA
ncbi:hypothetical protein F4810DRAFT_451359 [Camillea tinctor]|nr:hypothetical protein F4810DRAFT_451359 [Camillea tinctor]